MSRARIGALALVNWRGVFYERYLLDRHVTALEGANGAGKTTVMIAAYVALLPDLTRLRFTNVGESGATGGDRGIWGRLGEPARPAYTVLDLELAGGQRLIAGVRLRRLSEPSVEATTWLIRGLAPDVPLSELLLLRSDELDHVAELDEIKQAARRHGGALEQFRSTKEYFAALFEAGVTPLRLATDEDRTKLNEMLRTSMTGGISRVLTSELRSFLLKAEAGLGDVLGRMRENLEACRRTRAEVAESRVLERDISSVYEAGQSMFSAAYHAAQRAAAEAERAASEARAALATAEREASELAAQESALTAREEALEQEASAVRGADRNQAGRLERLRSARKLAVRLRELTEAAEARRAAAQLSAATLAAAGAERESARVARDRLHEAHRRAALGLAQLQDGLDELHRRAYAYRELGRALAELRALTSRPELEVHAVPQLREELSHERELLQAERARRQRDRDAAAARSHERQAAEAALAALEEALAYEQTHARTAEPLSRARTVLARLDELSSEVGRLGQLALESTELERLAVRQREAWTQAAALGIACGPERDARAELQQLLAASSNAAEAAEAELTQAAAALEAAAAALGELRVRDGLLAARAERWPALAAAAGQVERTLGLPLGARGREQLAAARAQSLEEAAELLARRRQLQTERDEALRLAADLAGAGAALDPELLRLRDELGADLLIERFDDAPVEQAAALEAALGPLAAALVVDDPVAAAQSIAGKPRLLADVWLVRAGADLELELEQDGGATASGDVVRVERFGARITRIPAQPAIGAGARTARASAVRERAESMAQALEACATRARQLAAAQRALDVLYEAQASWALGDPAAEVAELAAAQQQLMAAETAAAERLAGARERHALARARNEACVRLDGDARLFDGADYALAASKLQARIEQARRGQQLLAAVVEHRQTLRELLEALRAPAAVDEDPSTSAHELERLDGELERHYRAVAAADSVLAQRHASGWADADERLGAESELLPMLQAQHEEARLAVSHADRQVIDADAGWERAAAAAHRDGAEDAAAAAAVARASEELDALGGAPEDGLIADAEAELAAAERKSKELSQASRALIGELARTRERAERAAQACARARGDLERATAAVPPARDAWQAMQASAQQAGLELKANPETERSAAALAGDADGQRALLIERLVHSRGGAEAAREIEAAPDVLASWAIARVWLLRRVPAQIAGSDDPLRALERLRDDLDLLQERLSRQELDLRGASEDIARGIDVQLRRAATQVRRLNERIAGVEFGSIAGIRVQLRRVDRMEQILRALRDGEAQELLFLPSIPVEEALEEIFRRYGGGGRGGGQRLLDYREYLELAVEIRRKTSEQWELASPTKLSTGEAIGVGAALMMVVLAEWERDANLLRARAATGSLRFLFLDEANRLSHDNLGVLFELCRTLDLQLLIAAPEVARADGNTTYRLVRHLTEDGREEVIVSGRRAVATPLTAAESV